MSKIIPPPANYREGRRLRAWQLYETGWKQKDIAEALGVSEGAVSQWISKARVRGTQALRTVPHPGPHPKLSQEQWVQLPSLLDQGAEAFGFHGNVWTTERVAWLIKKQFGISYHPAHCSHLLHHMKYSQQKPITRATQRDEAAIATWRPHVPRAQKKAKDEERTLVFVDESGFYLLAHAVRTYAPVEKTPVWSVPLTRDHISAIGAITPDGRLFMQTQERPRDTQRVANKRAERDLRDVLERMEREQMRKLEG